jgi:hypothetical protein
VVKFCPGCGEPVAAGALACDTCGQEWGETGGVVVPRVSPPPLLTVADLTPRDLRREIRWGVFQGFLLIAGIALVIYVAIFLVVVLLLGSGNVHLLGG